MNKILAQKLMQIKTRIMKKCVGVSDRYGKGKVAYIDFTYTNHIIVWVSYKTVSIAYLWRG